MVARYSQSKLKSTRHRQALDSTMTGPAQDRFLLWVDAVGGFLVCPGEKLVLGQAIPENEVDVPIQADLSRRHATILRDGEAYLLLPSRNVAVDGAEATSATILSAGSEIDLGRGVRLRFRRPHPLSTSARLDVVSHHRTQPPMDGIILLADTCVLGPAPTSHIHARQWTGDVILYRRQGRLFCRAGGVFDADGKRRRTEAEITTNSRISGSDFSISLEKL